MNIIKSETRKGRQVVEVTTIEVDDANAYIRIIRYYDGEHTETIDWHRSEDGYSMIFDIGKFDELMAMS